MLTQFVLFQLEDKPDVLCKFWSDRPYGVDARAHTEKQTDKRNWPTYLAKIYFRKVMKALRERDFAKVRAITSDLDTKYYTYNDTRTVAMMPIVTATLILWFMSKHALGSNRTILVPPWGLYDDRFKRYVQKCDVHVFADLDLDSILKDNYAILWNRLAETDVMDTTSVTSKLWTPHDRT